MPAQTQRDKLLQKVNVSSHVHLAREPLFQRSLATSMADTTLQRAT